MAGPVAGVGRAGDPPSLLCSGVAPLDSLNADHVDLLMRRYGEALAAHRSVIDALNVYPVPDGDTGTNMSLTLRAVVDALPSDCDMRSVCQAIHDSALAAGRGNSGIIVSQFLRAMAGAWREAVRIDAAGLAGSLEAASLAAYGAVARPVEGTILTVGKDVAAAAAAAARREAPLAEVIEEAIEAGRESLERTPELLEVLRTAGVVDAGGKGLLLLLDALAHVVDGRPLPEPPEVAAPLLGDDPHRIEGAGDVADLRYEVMFLLDAGDDRIGAFRDRWEQLGGLHRGRRRRRAVELPHPHRRHRRFHRGRDRGRPPAPHRGHRPPRAGLPRGPRAGAGPHHDGGRGGGHRRRRRADLQVAGGRRAGDRRPDHEPLGGHAPGGRGAHPPRTA